MGMVIKMTPTYQTVKLTAGRHPAPQLGACVMELASMLAGERFSDAPRSVCPVIGAFLRTYNDRLDDDRRQDLYRYAAAVVGTRSNRATERLRAEMCVAWTRRAGGSPPLGYGLHRILSRRWRALPAAHAARFAAEGGPARHPSALGLLDALIAVGRPSGSPRLEGRGDPRLSAGGVLAP
jgi:hypothetical protein